jgi:hypothetical protein
MLQHVHQKFVDGLCGVHTCVNATIVMEEQYFRQFVGGTNSMKVSIQSFIVFRVHCFHVGKKFTKIVPFSSQKTVIVNLLADGTLLNFECYITHCP